MILVRPLGETSEYTYNLDPKEATQLRDELTGAIEEAKLQADPFEWWFDSIMRPQGKAEWAQACRIIHGEWVSRNVARTVWDAATKAKQ
jgi:hypothetical protein